MSLEDDIQRTKLVDLVEQLRDVWNGRDTYDDDEEWLDNTHEAIRDLLEFMNL